jgi:hypothetical protein
MDAHVGSRAIVAYLRSQAEWLENKYYQAAHVSASPRMYDGSTGKPIDLAAQVDEARRERKRKANEASIIPPHLRKSAPSGLKVR